MGVTDAEDLRLFAFSVVCLRDLARHVEVQLALHFKRDLFV